MAKKSSLRGWSERCSPEGQRGSGSALLQGQADVPLVLDALLPMVRSSGFGDRDVFGIRLALEEAIRHGFEHQKKREGRAGCVSAIISARTACCWSWSLRRRRSFFPSSARRVWA